MPKYDSRNVPKYDSRNRLRLPIYEDEKNIYLGYSFQENDEST